MSNLIQVTDQIRDLLYRIDEIEERGEKVPTELMDLVNQLVNTQADKIDASVSFYRYCENQIEWLKEEKNKIDSLIKRSERAMERLEYVARVAMQASQLDSLEGKLNTIKTRKSSYVQVIDQAELPNDFLRIKTTIEPDKEKIKSELMQGRDVPGAVLAVREKAEFK